ncbi:MAG: hypothetical protein MUO21_03055 [Nitrososphaeraceae archaeon]|nr:hypothetical protein [Nitrososphaeraceae archaeon]
MTSNNLVTFLVDDRKFVLTKNTFDDYPHSRLTQIINHEIQDKSISKDAIHDNVFHVNRDPKAFKYIIDHLRGYDVDLDTIKNSNLKNKVLHDLKYFNIDYKIINLNVTSMTMSTLVDFVPGQDAIENILNSTYEEYDEKDTPLLTKFGELLSEKIQTCENSTLNIAELVNSLSNGLENGSIPIDLINELSNNQEFKNIIKNAQNDALSESESETESLEIKSDNDTNSDSSSYVNSIKETKETKETKERYIEI